MPDENWKGRVGLITDLFKDISIDPENTFAIVCGPPVMFKFICTYLCKYRHSATADVCFPGAKDALRHGEMLPL